MFLWIVFHLVFFSGFLLGRGLWLGRTACALAWLVTIYRVDAPGVLYPHPSLRRLCFCPSSNS